MAAPIPCHSCFAMTTLTLPRPKHLLIVSDLMLLLVAVVWGTSYGVAKGALAYYPVLGFLAVRFGLTFILLLPALWRLPRVARRDALRSGLPLGGLLLGIFLCETYGVAHTQASNAAFLISLCVVFTPFAEWGLLGVRPRRAVFAFAAVSLLGAALLSGGLAGAMGLGRWPDAGRSGAARRHRLPDQQTDPSQQRTGAGAHCGAGRRDCTGLPAAGTGHARGTAGLAPGGRVLAGQCLPRFGLHGVCVLCPKLGPATQRPQPRGLAHQQRAGLWRAVCGVLAGRKFESLGVVGRRA